MRKRSLLLAGAALAATLPFAAVQPASAASVCATGKVCAWTGANFTGTRYDRTASEHGCDAPGPVNTSFRTISNQSRFNVTVYSEDGCYGSTVVIRSGHYSGSLPFKARAYSW
ncbi:peptidase inhibitor family I36 protein [Streptomyces cyanogenus]|uniref:Peptidase inhibitor family I36 n=1 Tax=Streptomyces cyanogenus TaxID=80860 RepID=A0ABX7TSD2_STRCY|nr:peptidase inhibitor family I36 protein [Streptomyces cyanogenus]QTD99654.1 hypothetical protein S1361_20120 [Streptomyces cyanogenus]